MDELRIPGIFGLNAFEAFRFDAEVLNVEADESRLPVRWLAAAETACRLADSTQNERQFLIVKWTTEVATPDEQNIWTAIAAPGIVVTDLTSALETLLAMATECQAGGAFHLAYCLALNVRLTLMDRGPADLRSKATRKQAEVLVPLGFLSEAGDTYAEALEDAVRARDRVAEAEIARALAEIEPRAAAARAAEEAAWISRMRLN